MAPALQAGGNAFATLYWLIPNDVERSYRDQALPFLTRLAGLSFLDPLGNIEAAYSVFDNGENLATLKAAMFSDGFRTALVYFGAAIILHHVRQTLLSWVGAFLYFRPMEEMRLAISNPDVFLEAALSFKWSWLVLSGVAKLCVDISAGFAFGVIVNSTRSVTSSTSNEPNNQEVFLQLSSNDPNQQVQLTLGKPGVQILKALYMVWVLCALEFAFEQAMALVSFTIAYSKLALGGKAEHTALANILKAHWLHALVTSWMLSHFVWVALWPISRISTRQAVSGQPNVLLILLGVVQTVYSLLRYRSTLFLAIELSGLTTVLGLTLLALILLGLEFFNNSLNTNTGIVMLQSAGSHVRRVFSPAALSEQGATESTLPRKDGDSHICS